jgi:hypothetical protein
MATTGGGFRAAFALALLAGPAAAADIDAPYRYGGMSGSPRYFPRSDGVEPSARYGAPAAPIPVGCVPRRAAVPTNAPDDPSYVGSEYGLSRPSRYGFTPPPGIDDPFGRPLLPYCR